MTTRANLFLIGYRACGKTTLGRLLAERLGRVFVDTDERAVARAGESIAELVAREGWEAFRALEHAVLAEVCAAPGQVVACGGGIVLLPENRELLRQAGTVVYLGAEPAVLAARLTADPLHGQRPSLTGKPLTEEIAEVLAERLPLYTQAADHVLDADRPLETLVAETLALLDA